MRVNELRIGNLITVHDCIQEVVELPLPENCTPENTKPIPLTEEWLLRFGAEKFDFDHKEPQYRIKERLFVIRDGFFCDYGTSVNIKYVHQLQNLYFALTGTELTLKP